MTTTPRGATELVASQAVPETTVNQQIRHTEAGACHFIVADNDLTAPPGSCADGASYIIAATATGAWAGKEKQIATALGTNASGGWTYHAPAEGFTAYIQDEDARHLYDGSAWVADTTGGSFTTATTTEVLTGTDSAKAVTPDSLAAIWEQGADVASAGTTSLGEGGYFNITGTTTITDIDFATDKAGRKAWVKFAGALTLTHNASTLILPTGANITTAAGDTACFVSEGSDVIRCVAYQRASGSALVDATGGSGGASASYATGVPGVIAVSGTTSGAPGTGAFTPNAAVSGSRAWSTVFTGWTGLVRFDDGSSWEYSFCYWNGTTLSRASTQMFDSSSGSPISLTSAATATLICDINQFLDSSFAGPVRGSVMRSNSATFDDIGCTWTNVQSPTAAALATTNYLTGQPRVTYTSATTANASNGRTPSQAYLLASSTAGIGGGLMSFKLGWTQLPTAPRLFLGGSTGSLSGATEPSALVESYVLCAADSTDTNLQFMVNNNSGSGTKTDTGIAWVINAWYHYAMWNYPGSLEWHQLLVREDTGAIYYRKTSTDVPPTATGLQPFIRGFLTASTGTAIIMDLGEVKLKAGR